MNLYLRYRFGAIFGIYMILEKMFHVILMVCFTLLLKILIFILVSCERCTKIYALCALSSTLVSDRFHLYREQAENKTEKYIDFFLNCQSEINKLFSHVSKAGITIFIFLNYIL